MIVVEQTTKEITLSVSDLNKAVMDFLKAKGLVQDAREVDIAFNVTREVKTVPYHEEALSLSNCVVTVKSIK